MTAALPSSALALRDALAAGEVSALDACEAHLARIEAVNPKLNAIVEVDAERARADAAALDRRSAEERGPLHGLPIAVKDLQDARGLRTTRGSLAWAEHRAERDEPWLAQVRAAGAIVVGKTNTPELGTKPVTVNRVYGATRNPWSAEHGTGGSSGGAGAAVSAGLVPLAQGSDAGGSCRQPAACCAVVGIKTSRGRVAMPDTGPGFGPALDTIGPFARTVADAALFLDALADPAAAGASDADAGAFLAAARPERASALRLAVVRAVHHPGAERSPEVYRLFDEAVGRLAALGHDVEEVDPRLDELTEPWLTMVLAAMAQLGEMLSDAELDALEPGNRAMIARGAATAPERVAAAVASAERATARILAQLDPYDALLTPTLTRPPFPRERLTPESSEEEIWRAFHSWAEYLHPFNVTGQPAMSVPAGFTADGLPVGLQIIGPPGGEAAILPLAAQFEQATWPAGVPRPPVGD